MNDINDFINYVKQAGIQRTNRYQIIMNIPDTVMARYGDLVDQVKNNQPGYNAENLEAQSQVSSSADLSKTLSLMALDTNTPGYNVSAVDMKIGTTRKVAYDKSTGDFHVTFRCSGDMSEKKLFDAWRNQMFRSDHSTAFYDDYVSEAIQILTLDLAGNVTYQTTLSEAYPAIITELNMNAEEANVVMTFQVTFNYRKMYNSDEDYTSDPIEYPPVFGGNVEVPEQILDLSLKSLPNAPAVGGQELFLIDVFKNIGRVKKQIEAGTLGSVMGGKLVTNILRDVKAAGVDIGITNKALEYGDDVLFALKRYVGEKIL